MEMTGVPVLLAGGAVLLVLLAASVADRPRPRHPWARGVVRLVRTVTVVLLALALAGLQLNRQYLFYTSWSDVLGSMESTQPAGTVHQRGDVAATVDARLAEGHRPPMGTPAVLPPLPQPGRRLQTYRVTTPDGHRATVLVRLPRGYDPRTPHRHPVVLALHGFPSGPLAVSRLGVLASVDDAVVAGRLADPVVVIPQINVPSTLDTECLDGAPQHPQTETWLARTLPTWTAAHFRVRTDRLSWAALGYSFGGWCAQALALRHPAVFGASVAFQGYLRPAFAPGSSPPPGVDLAAYDLVALERRSPVPVAMWMLTSRQDPLSYPSSTELLAVARPPTTVRSVVLPSGGHRVALWKPYLPQALGWLGSTLPGFRPSAQPTAAVPVPAPAPAPAPSLSLSGLSPSGLSLSGR